VGVKTNAKGFNMSKKIVLVVLLTGLAVSTPSLRAGQTVQFTQCLHGASEQPSQRIRRDLAFRMAEQINRAEGSGLGAPRSRRYRPLEQLANVPPTPLGFRLQFYTDGPTYTFSLKDTTDPCHYAIFSDQDQGIYQATARTGAQVVPAEIP
jgi:hypothetical protein